MPLLIVEFDGAVQKIPYAPGPSLRELLEACGIPIRCGCRGNGACGLCLVQIESGNANTPTQSERLFLSQEQLDNHVRFACQLMPKTDMTLRIIGLATRSKWREPAPGALPRTRSPFYPFTPDTSIHSAFGLAIDIGTTHISLSLWDLSLGTRIATRVGANSQAAFGSDVVSRLTAAAESADSAKQLANDSASAIFEALHDMSQSYGINPAHVTRVAVVGNTAMLLLLTMGDPQTLLAPANWAIPITCPLENTFDWSRKLQIPETASVDIIQPFAGFVGSDLLAGILSTGLTTRPKSLLIDFGTNSELALWDGELLWISSAAGGPAFETSRIRCGMPAEPGAVCRVSLDEQSSGFHFDVIGGLKAIGICGSGLVDLIACLRRTGELSATGRFTGQSSANGFSLSGFENPLRLSHFDVDMFQRAKAGIGAGITTLLKSAKIKASELDGVYVCGVFGSMLDIGNAQSIGLLPSIGKERVTLCGNTALAGCEQLLLNPSRASAMAKFRSNGHLVNLANAPDFESRFIENLFLHPIQDDLQ